MFANSSKWGLSRFKFAGSPVRWRAIVSSWTLCAKEAGVCNLKKININFQKPPNPFKVKIIYNIAIIFTIYYI